MKAIESPGITRCCAPRLSSDSIPNSSPCLASALIVSGDLNGLLKNGGFETISNGDEALSGKKDVMLFLKTSILFFHCEEFKLDLEDFTEFLLKSTS